MDKVEIGTVQDVADGALTEGYTSIFALTFSITRVSVFCGSPVVVAPNDDYQLLLRFAGTYDTVWADIESITECNRAIQELTVGVSKVVAGRLSRRGERVRYLVHELMQSNSKRIGVV